jgi:hypothetical protein
MFRKRVETFSETLKRKNSSRQSVRMPSIDSDMLLKMTLHHQKSANTRKADCEARKLDYEKRTQQKEEITSRVNTLSEEMKVMSSELKHIRNDLLIHYHNLLSQGVEAR